MCKQGQEKSIMLNGKIVTVDRCLFPILNQLDRLGIITKASCCGHGDKRRFYIVIAKNSYVSEGHPFYKLAESIILRNSKIPLIPRGMRAIDGLFVVNKSAKVTKGIV